MNKEIKDFIDEKVEQFKSELIKSIEEKENKSENKPKTVWDLKGGDVYYTIYPRDIVCYPFDRDNFDIQTRENGNMFLTQEEAEFELERRKIEAIIKKYSRPFEYEEENHYIFYAYSNKSICISSRIRTDDGIPHFESKKMAQKVIDKIGEERLKKYWFRVGNNEYDR